MRFLTLLCLFFLCTACSFSPLYSEKKDEAVLQETAQIQIEPIEGVLGYTIRDQLNAKLQTKTNQNKKYTLNIKISENIIGDLGIQKTNFATRSRMILTAHYILKDCETNQVLLNTQTNASGSYNLTTTYSTMTAKDKMRQNLAKILADNISIRLLMYFKKQEASFESAKTSN